MLRFLRHYNKLLLGVFGLLLLFAWAIGGSLSQISSYTAREGATWATIGPSQRKVTIADLERVQQELRVVDELKQFVGRGQLLPVSGADTDPAHWYLLTREAEDAGLVGGAQDSAILLDALAASLPADESGEKADANMAAALLAGRANTNPHVVRETIAKINGVFRLADLVSSIPHLSDSRLKQAAAETLRGVSCDLVVLDAHTLTKPDVAEPAPADLEQQLKAFGEFERGKGEKGFGYRLPNRAQLEWIQISEAPVRAAVERGAALDALTLKKKFAENPTKYGAPPEFSSDPLSVFPQYEQSVRQKVLDELVAERMKEIVKFASDQFAQSQRGLKRDGWGLYVLPEDWGTRKPDLKQLAASIGEQFGIPAPTYYSVAVWQDPTEIGQISGIGTASTTQFGEKAIAFKDLVQRLREFATDATKAEPLIQMDVATPALTATNEDAYFARITAVDPARAPKSLEEAPPTLADDVRAINRFAALGAMIAEIEKEAKDDGLMAVATTYGAKLEPVQDVREADPRFLAYGRIPSTVGSLGNDINAVKAISERVAKLPTGVPLADVPAADRTFVIPLDKALKYAVVRVTDVTPLTSEEFESISANPRAQAALANTGQSGALDAFTLDALTKRYDFKTVRSKDTEEDGTKPASDTKPTPAKAG